ncbi:MAG: bifunctional folylpolyglutamate synthase/dihydrofolate synthase, partial [Anaerolineales bacterium]
IQINRVPIAPDAFVPLVEAVKPHVAAIPGLTMFEIEAALAFWHFAREGVGVGVIEVGMGGRLDATNVVMPLVSVITSISLDHTPILGNTHAEIAAEKAGIIKKNRPIVAAPNPRPVRETIARIARERRAPIFGFLSQMSGSEGEDYRYSTNEQSLEGQSFLVWNRNERIELKISLLGAHQVENAATAYAALQIARKEGLQIDQDAIRTGFATATWPGRFEILRPDSISPDGVRPDGIRTDGVRPDGIRTDGIRTIPPLVIDSAHNVDSTRRLCQTLDDYFPARPVTLVLGVSGDKDVRGILAELRPRITGFIATTSTHPRAMPPEKLATLANESGLRAIPVTAIENALHLAIENTPPNGLVLVTGSIFVAGAARTAWERNPY